MDIRFASLEEAGRELEKLGARGALVAEGALSLPQIWTHCAQSIRYSLTGFPEQRSFVVRKLIGPLVAGRFLRRGAMSHDRAAPIPGAPAIPREGDAAAALVDLLEAIRAFDAHSGALAPHFAFGVLDKDRFSRLHAMHIADHLGEVRG